MSTTATVLKDNGLPSYVSFTTGHEDLIHDVAYDFYGRRMATVSSDQKLKVFDKNDLDEWVLTASIRAHEATITKVIWAPPEHGQILATASHDRTVAIFEESETEPPLSPHRWKRQYQITSESRTAISSIAFPPTFSTSSASSTTSLKIALISNDGVLALHECREPQDLTHWISIEPIPILPTAPPREIEVSFCLAFCPSRPGDEQLVVGAMDQVRIYRANAHGRFREAEELPGHRELVRDVAWATSMGRSHHLIATACKDGHVRIFKLSHKSMQYVIRPREASQQQQRGHGGSTATQGGRGRLSVGLAAGRNGEGEGENGEEEEMERWDVQKIADFDDHKADVWKVGWNATGTILSSVGDDGKIRLWKAAISGEWTLMSVVNTPKMGR